MLNSLVPATQTLLFPDPRPLVERLGRDFFRQLPERAGVYLMRDATDAVLYVGKAKNLRKRLGSYRVANPDRLPRRHLRMLRAVQRIELQECTDEAAALTRESELLRALKPKFNRAGTWPATPRFLTWRTTQTAFELAVTEAPVADWQVLGPLKSNAIWLRVTLARLLWLAAHPESGFTRMPAGWAEGIIESPATISYPTKCETVGVVMEKLLANQPDAFCEWIRERVTANLHPFEKAAVDADLEFISEFFPVKG